MPGGSDWRSRPQKSLDGLVGGCKMALASGGLPATGGLRPAGHGHHRLPRPPRTPPPPRTRHRRQPGSATGWQPLAGPTPADTAPGRDRSGSPAPGRWPSPDPSPPPPSARSPATRTSSPSCSVSEGRVLDIGRTSRIFPPHIRKAITARDQGCTFPGCTIPAPWCEAHHIDYWSTAAHQHRQRYPALLPPPSPDPQRTMDHPIPRRNPLVHPATPPRPPPNTPKNHIVVPCQAN